MQLKDKKASSFVEIVGYMGAILVIVGVFWLIAWNWHSIPSFLKIAILVFSTIFAFSAGVGFRHYDYEKTGRAVLVLGALLYVASIFLIAQIYSTNPTVQGVAWLLLLSWLGVVLSAYALDSPENVFVGLVVFLGWFVAQYISLIEKSGEYSFGILAFGFLGIGVFLYALNLLHSGFNHRFSKVYQFWSVFYFVAIFYLLSFQILLPMFWEDVSFSGGSFFFVLFLFTSSVLFLIIGTLVAFGKRTLHMKELVGFVLLVLVIGALLTSTVVVSGTTGTCRPVSCYDLNTQAKCNSAPSANCQWRVEGSGGSCGYVDCFLLDENSCKKASSCKWFEESTGEGSSISECQYNNQKIEEDLYKLCSTFNNQKENCLDETNCQWNSRINYTGETSFAVWFLWILINVFFIGFIILVLGYGKFKNSQQIINLGISAFVIDIITRYIGFIMRWGKGFNMLAILFIAGGILLIVLGWGVTKWRRSLLSEIHDTQY